MWSSLLSRPKIVSPKTPEGVRVYAIGDVHGRADLLAQMFSIIDADIAARPPAQVVQVLLGDYVDRGRQSREVIERLLARGRQEHRIVCLKGNHETYIEEFIRNPAILDQWRQLGGLETLVSYGVIPSLNPSEDERSELAASFARALPESHLRFLRNLATSFACGDYFFAHAGVRPGVPLTEQLEQDLLWIRDDFLQHEQAFGKIVIHGHTPVAEPDIRPNRINIDTGAYATGRLTCLMLEGEDMLFI